MKNWMIAGTLFALCTTAQATQLVCTTNIHKDHHQPTTMIKVESFVRGRAQITLQTIGGRAHFVTAPRTFPANVKNRGPELVEFYNIKEDFELSLFLRPIAGTLHGTFTGEVMGGRVQTPVVCTRSKIIPLNQ